MSYDIVSTSTENGFSFSPTLSSVIESISIRLTAFEGISAGRTITLAIKDGGLFGPTLFTDDFVIPNTLTPTDTPFTIVAGPSLTSGNSYTISITDITAGGSSTGFANFYGISQDANFISTNTNVYPKLSVTMNPSLIDFFQSSADIATTYILTSEQGFYLSPTQTGAVTTVVINLSSFESVDPGRTLRLRIRNLFGLGGAILHQQDFVLTNNTTNADVTLNITLGPTLTFGNDYTLTLEDITAGGLGSGVIYIFGIYGNSYGANYSVINTYIYPKLTVSSIVSASTFIQPNNPVVSDTVSNVIEKGFEILPISSGYLTKVIMMLSSFGVPDRTVTLRIRQGSGVGGTILYQSNFVIQNQDSSLYTFFLDTSPMLQSGIYTITLQDTVAGTGNVTLYGITSGGSFISYNTVVYPLLQTIVPSFIISITPPQDFAGFLNDGTDNIEFNTQARENASTLLYNGGIPSTSISYYKIGLKWLVLPNQLLKVGDGGKLDNYPYVYVQLYNDGNSGYLKSMDSNNPNSIQAIFKVPVDRNLYDIPRAFYTLKIENKDQIVKFRPDQDIRFRIILPDGTTVQNNTDDNQSPLFPNELLQVNAAFTLLPWK